MGMDRKNICMMDSGGLVHRGRNGLNKYKARYVLFPRHEPLTYFMEHDPKWKTVYSDQLSVLLERIEDDPRGKHTGN